MRNILCLDIDGVLWNASWSEFLHKTKVGGELFDSLKKKKLVTPLSPENIANLNFLCANVQNIEIAITSSWLKLDTDDTKSTFYNFINRHLEEAGFEYLQKISTEWNYEKDKTKKVLSILKDINLNKEDNVIVVDDKAGFLEEVKTETFCQSFYFEVSNKSGLTLSNAEDICFAFNKEYPPLPMVLF